MPIDYVSLDDARAHTSTRIVTSSLVPSPWSEAVKAMFEITKLPCVVVARGRDNKDIDAWSRADNVPVVLHGDEPPRTNWAAIVGLVARLAPGAIVPADPAARAEVMGLVDLIAGENGLGWTSRLAMIRASITSEGKRGFMLPVGAYLAKRYGYTPDVDDSALRTRVSAQLAVLRARLGGADYFGGSTPSAIDAYMAAFLTPLSQIDETHCPQLMPALRQAFGTAAELLADLVPETLWALRTRMFERHLSWPIRLA